MDKGFIKNTEKVMSRMKSGEYWIIVLADTSTMAFCDHIADKYYSGEASDDFDLVIVPNVVHSCPPIIVATAKKTRMSSADVKDLTGQLYNTDLLISPNMSVAAFDFFQTIMDQVRRQKEPKPVTATDEPNPEAEIKPKEESATGVPTP